MAKQQLLDGMGKSFTEKYLQEIMVQYSIPANMLRGGSDVVKPPALFNRKLLLRR